MVPDLHSTEDFEPLRDFDFGFDKSPAPPLSPSIGHFKDRKTSSMDHSGHFVPRTDSVAQVHAPLAFRPHKVYTRENRSSAPVISGSQLLHLEGQPARQERMATAISVSQASSNPHTLSRKDKFYSGPHIIASRGGLQHPARTPSSDANDVVYHSPLEDPSAMFDMTQHRMENITLHTPSAGSPPRQMSYFPESHRPVDKYANGETSPRTYYTHKKARSEASSSIAGYPHQHTHQPLFQYSHAMSHSLLRETDNQMPILTQSGSDHFDDDVRELPHFTGHFSRAVRPSSTFDELIDYNSDLRFNSSQVELNWLTDTSAYDTEAQYHPQSAVSLPTPTTQGHPLDLGHQGEFSTGYPQTVQHAHHRSLNDAFDSLTSPVAGNTFHPIPQPPQTPPPSNPSASPSSPPNTAKPQQSFPAQPQVSPNKSSKGNRRSKQGTLRMPKSTAALKTTKSNGHLKPTKSTGNLRSRKSAGNLGGGGVGSSGGAMNAGGAHDRSPIKKSSHQHHHRQQQHQQQIQQRQSQQQQQGLSIGFLNFTPSDADKLLTGVAPSGSSKTKARREQEERESKRRMSLAVKREIERLGGDMPAELMTLEED